jgi:hypothetical protein
MSRSGWILTALALALPAGGVLAQQTAKNEPAQAAPRVRFRGVSALPAGAESVNLEFEAENRTSKPIPYLGFVADPGTRPDPKARISPLYQVQFEREAGWKPHGIGWCGTGLGPVQLEPGKKATFIISVPLDNWQSVKAGLSWYPTTERQNAQVAWSEAVPRKSVGK